MPITQDQLIRAIQCGLAYKTHHTSLRHAIKNLESNLPNLTAPALFAKFKELIVDEAPPVEFGEHLAVLDAHYNAKTIRKNELAKEAQYRHRNKMKMQMIMSQEQFERYKQSQGIGQDKTTRWTPPPKPTAIGGILVPTPEPSPTIDSAKEAIKATLQITDQVQEEKLWEIARKQAADPTAWAQYRYTQSEHGDRVRAMRLQLEQEGLIPGFEPKPPPELEQIETGRFLPPVEKLLENPFEEDIF